METSTSILSYCPAILQIYFCTLNMKYTSGIVLEVFWFPKFATLWKQLETNLENDLYLSTFSPSRI